MKCEFCREEIAEDALVCPHCRRKTYSGRVIAAEKRWVAAAWIVGVPIALIVLLLFIGSRMPERNSRDRIIVSCNEQFGANTEETARCKLALTEKSLDDARSDRIRRAASEAGVRP